MEVTRCNNRQNKIENRDFASQDPEQIRIRQELGLEGIDYNINRSELFTPSITAIDVLEAVAALACASGDPSLATQAKKGIGKYFDNLDSGIYKRLFNPSVQSVYVYNAVRVERKISEILQKKIEALPKKYGPQYGLLVHGNRIIELLVVKKEDLLSKLSKVSDPLDDVLIEKALHDVVAALSEVVEADYKDSIRSVLFKSSVKCQDISSKVLKKLATN